MLHRQLKLQIIVICITRVENTILQVQALKHSLWSRGASQDGTSASTCKTFFSRNSNFC
jgi:hypothetical protein